MSFQFRPIHIPPLLNTLTNNIEVCDNEIQQIFLLPDFLDVGFCFLNSGKTIIYVTNVLIIFAFFYY